MMGDERRQAFDKVEARRKPARWIAGFLFAGARIGVASVELEVRSFWRIGAKVRWGVNAQELGWFGRWVEIESG
jgi:hypothetical protein